MIQFVLGFISGFCLGNKEARAGLGQAIKSLFKTTPRAGELHQKGDEPKKKED